MKNVLLVSPYPYSKTSRGIDVLTECFEESGWDTSHLVFPNVFYTVKKMDMIDSRVIQITARRAVIPYIDSIMNWFPGFLFKIMQTYQASKAKCIDFGQFDYIVLESGKPLFLLDLIPENIPIIYRQSDSVRYILGKNKYYIGLEEEVFERAKKIIVVKDRFKTNLGEHIQQKIHVIRNGFTIPEDVQLENPYENNSFNAVYVGLTKLDVNTLKIICQKNPRLNVHIFGSCLTRLDLWKLKNIENLFFYGFQPKEKYLSYIKYADVAIFPFKDWAGMKWVGFTTKYLNFMYYKLPIVSYLTGEKSEFDGMGVYFASDANEFASLVTEIIALPKRIDSRIDFDYFSHPQRKNEYKSFIGSLN